MLYEILKTSKLGASFAPDMYTALWAQKLARDGEVKTLSGAPPLSFQANGTPLHDYLISGNTVQSGTPTPDSPIIPQGTGERTGNLFDKDNVTHDTLSADGSISHSNAMDLSGLIAVDGDFAVSWNAVINGAYMRISTYDENKNFIERIAAINTYSNSSYTNSHIGYIRINYENDHQLSQVQVNLGSIPIPYEPYGQYKIPISSADTTTPVYLGEVQTTRKIKKLVLSSSQNWRLQSINSHGIANFYITISNDFLNIAPVISNYFTRQTTAIADTTTEGMFVALSTNSATVYIRIKSQTASTAQEFKDWLDGLSEEAAIWYILATEETAVVNEPLMKIGDYADTVSMEQAGVEIPTTRGTNTLDVLTDVKPSEVYIKYKS